MGALRQLVYICAAGEPGGGQDGVFGFERDPGTGELVSTGVHAAAERATFISFDPSGKHLYATRAQPEGGVTALAVGEDGGLAGLGTAPTGGAGPCHVAVDPSGRYLLSAHYGSGHLAVHRLVEDGSIGERRDLVVGEGGGPVPGRQEHAHAHFVWPEPTGRFVLLVDLGTDSVRTYALDGASGRLEEVADGRAEPGSGPRHLLLHPDGYLLVTGELGSSLMTFGYDPGTGVARFERSVPASREAGPGDNAPSELALGPGSRFCYVANRGPDTIGVFSLEGGSPSLVAEVACGGRTPRHLAVIGEHLYVANQDSGAVVVFALDPDSGVPHPTGASVALDHPYCIRPLP